MKNTFLVASITFFTLQLYGCGEQPGSTSGGWMAEIYPDASALTESRPLGEYPSFDACVEAAMEALGGDGIFNCSTS